MRGMGALHTARATTVEIIAQDRVSPMRKMNANLMGATSDR